MIQEYNYPKHIFSLMRCLELLYKNKLFYETEPQKWNSEDIFTTLSLSDFYPYIQEMRICDIVNIVLQLDNKYEISKYKWSKYLNYCDVLREWHKPSIYKYSNQSELGNKQLKKLNKYSKNEIKYLNLNKYNIAVCAAMSAGKSTLINSILGYDILPGRNEATTAKITTIYNNSNYSLYGICKKESGLDIQFNTNSKIVNEWNSSPNTEHIYLQRKFSEIWNIEKICAAIHDTPGVNNSSDASHRNITFRFLSEYPINAVIYVANAEHYGTDDENNILEELNDIAQKRSIPIIIAFNKIDSLDTEKEKLSDIIADFEKFISSIGIKKHFPIVPISARAALLFRKALDGKADTFSPRENINFDADFNYFAPQEKAAAGYCIKAGRNYYYKTDILKALHKTKIKELEDLIIKKMIQ